MKSVAGVDLEVTELTRLRAQAGSGWLKPKQKARAMMAGQYHSAFKGRGMDFDQLRPYQVGDDIRRIDWRVTARTGKTHTKCFHEERERPVQLYVDLGVSMRFGSQVAFKSVTAARAAAVIAWSATAQGDRVGGMVSAGDCRRELRPRGRDQGAINLIQSLCRLHAEAPNEPTGSPLNLDLQHLLRSVKSGSLVVLLSDFYNLDDGSERYLGQLARHNVVVLGHVYDKLEQNLPRAGRLGISNGQQQTMLDTRDKQVVNACTGAFQQRLLQLQKLARKHAMHHLFISTAQPVQQQLEEGLLRRLHGDR